MTADDPTSRFQGRPVRDPRQRPIDAASLALEDRLDELVEEHGLTDGEAVEVAVFVAARVARTVRRAGTCVSTAAIMRQIADEMRPQAESEGLGEAGVVLRQWIERLDPQPKQGDET